MPPGHRAAVTNHSRERRQRRRHDPSSPAGGAVAAATLSPAPDGSKRRHRPLGACLLPIGPARPRPANGVGASGLPLSAAAAAPRRGRLQEAVGCRWAALVSPPWPRLSLPEAAMPQFQTWEEFSRAAEKLYLADPMKVRVVLKYRHVDGNLCIKVTDDLVCLVYRTDQAQDVKKIEKFHSQLMRLMVAKESRSVSMETE